MKINGHEVDIENMPISDLRCIDISEVGVESAVQGELNRKWNLNKTPCPAQQHEINKFKYNSVGDLSDRFYCTKCWHEWTLVSELRVSTPGTMNKSSRN